MLATIAPNGRVLNSGPVGRGHDHGDKKCSWSGNVFLPNNPPNIQFVLALVDKVTMSSERSSFATICVYFLQRAAVTLVTDRRGDRIAGVNETKPGTLVKGSCAKPASGCGIVVGILLGATLLLVTKATAADFACGSIRDPDIKQLCYAGTCLLSGADKPSTSETTNLSIAPEWVSYCKSVWNLEAACEATAPKLETIRCTADATKVERWVCDHLKTWSRVVCSHCTT